jgi:hypothetical protein
MDFFENKYRIVLKMTQHDFVEKLSNATRHRDGIHRDIFPDTKKDFIGEVEYSHFTLARNYSAIFRNNYKLLGTTSEHNDNELTVEGVIKGYKFSLVFLLTYTLGCIFFLVYNLSFNPDSKDSIRFLLIFSVIGLINSIGLVIGLNNYKNSFLKMLKNFEKKEIPKR